MQRVVVPVGALMVLSCVALSGQDRPAVDWQTLDARAEAFYVKGDFAQALSVAQGALRVAATPEQSGRSLGRVGFYFYQSGNLSEGERYLRQSLHVREAAFGAGSLEYAETANDLAQLLRDRRQLTEAKTLAKQAVATRAQLLGISHRLLAESLNTEGGVLGFEGDYAAAVSRFERAMAIHELRPPAERTTEEYGTLCINLAGTYQRLGKYGSAESTFRKGLDVLRVSPGENHPAYAVSVVAFAFLEVDLGHYAEAERLFDEGGRLFKATLSEDHPLYTTFLNNRGFLYHTIGNFAAAEGDYRRSLELRRRRKESDLSIASTLKNLGYLLYSRDPAQSEQLLREAADVYAKLASAPSFDHAKVLIGLARAQRDRGALSESRATIDRAVTVTQPALGVHHPVYAAAIRDRGLVQAASGELDDAERSLREAIAIAEAAHGADHPEVAPFLDSLAGLLAQRNDFAAAEPLYRRSFDIRERFLDDVLDIGSESFKATSMASALDPIPMLIGFQERAASQVPRARELAFEIVTQRKGRVLEQVRNWRQALREQATDPVRRRLSEWEAIVACRTSLTLALGAYDLKPGIVGACALEGTDLAGRYEGLLSDIRGQRTEDAARQAVQAVAALKERGDALEASMNRETGGVAGASRRVSVNDVCAQLADDELLIELVSFNEERPGKSGRRYGAFVLDRNGALEWTDIGPAAAIDAAARDLLAAANDWSISLRNRETRSAASAEATARDILADLSKRIWTPLEPLIETRPHIQHLRIAPDAALNLVPFEALSDRRPLIERFAISYVPAGRDVAAPAPEPRSSSTPAIVIVSPGADTRSDRVVAEQTSFRAGSLGRLAAAAAEAADFQKIVRGAELYAFARATEREVKRIHAPPLLHIVGHGMIHGLEACATCGTRSGPADDAMALSAIVLEEAYGRGRGSAEDGMLTPLELQNVDLRGTEMLVLSQCRMASGVASVGEGVYGMRRAAAIAGARTFVAPLWNVRDDVQRTLMKRFYGGLASSLTRAEALRRAKLDLRRSPATRSFLYWAPVILSGASSPLPASFFER